jgi:type VI secretion system protein ImpH
LSVDQELFQEGYRFDFFQAVRLLERLAPHRRPVGRQGTVAEEVVRFRAATSLDFPASSIERITPPTDNQATAEMWVNFMGLTGPSGILPRHYTEMLIRRHIDFRGHERYVLRDWLDLLNHRLISLFYRAWEKYRFWTAFERDEYLRGTPDTFTIALRSLVGLAPHSLHNRLGVTTTADTESNARTPKSTVLARIEDVSLLRYTGLMSQRPRTASNLQAILSDYFLLPARIEQFQGQWLLLEPDDQLRLGSGAATGRLGMGAVVGPRVWNVQGKFRIRLGPLSYRQFCELFPDPDPTPKRKLFFLLSQLVQLYAGPEFDFDVQLILRRHEVPRARLAAHGEVGARLGWNTWLCNRPPTEDSGDAVIAGHALRHCARRPSSVSIPA